MSDYQMGGIRDRLTIAVLDGIWNERRYAYSGDDMEYIGLNSVVGASTALENWIVIKFTYSSDRIVRRQILEGSWDNRASLGW
jgi:hypothetical protein